MSARCASSLSGSATIVRCSSSTASAGSRIGVNSPEFLQKKIERLKTALDEANVLMDRQGTERDEARAQLDVAKREREELERERDELQRQLDEARALAAGAPPPIEAPAVDPEVERELRERIAQLENERETLQATQS